MTHSLPKPPSSISRERQYFELTKIGYSSSVKSKLPGSAYPYNLKKDPKQIRKCPPHHSIKTWSRAFYFLQFELSKLLFNLLPTLYCELRSFLGTNNNSLSPARNKPLWSHFFALFSSMKRRGKRYHQKPSITLFSMVFVSTNNTTSYV